MGLEVPKHLEERAESAPSAPLASAGFPPVSIQPVLLAGAWSPWGQLTWTRCKGGRGQCVRASKVLGARTHVGPQFPSVWGLFGSIRLYDSKVPHKARGNPLLISYLQFNRQNPFVKSGH